MNWERAGVLGGRPGQGWTETGRNPISFFPSLTKEAPLSLSLSPHPGPDITYFFDKDQAPREESE